MSIVLVGGHDRMHDIYKSVCNKYGISAKVYTQMPARFDKAIGSPDGLILLTNTVSHKMVLAAVKEAKRKNIPVVRCHSSSASSLENMLRTMKDSQAIN
ncbi:MAG: DUF2325 domain-containing protein [Clostridia bacterium]|nr:DUF2325 domain-containing protein [Clostridia bacterium]